MKITVYYFGADESWDRIKSKETSRRNTCLLSALAANSRVQVVVVTVLAKRLNRVKTLLRIRWGRSAGITDLYLPLLLPGQSKVKFIKRWNAAICKTYLSFHSRLYGFPRESYVFAYWPKGLQQALWLNICAPIIFDADHNILDDNNSSESQKKELSQLLVEAKAENVHGIAAARTMLKHFNRLGISCSRLRNGVYPNRFGNNSSIPKELIGIKSPIVGYIGALSKWFDIQLMLEIAKQRHDWIFVVIGETYKVDVPTKYKNIDNILFIGRRSADEIPSYLKCFDVAINLYYRKAWMDPDSMKLYEYLASGTPVISTPFHNYLGFDFQQLLMLAESTDEIIQKIEGVLRMTTEEIAEWKRKALHFARKNTWDDRAAELINILRELRPLDSKCKASV